MKKPIENKELLQMSRNHAALHKFLEHFYRYDVSYEETLEQALIHYITANQEMFEEFVALKMRAIIMMTEGDLSLKKEALLKSVQIQLANSEKRYGELLERFNASEIERQVTDKENRIMEHALTIAKYDVKKLIGRKAREYDENL